MINLKIESSEIKIAIGKAIINAIMKTSSPLEASSLEELGENYLAIVNDNNKRKPSFSTDLLFDIFNKNVVSEEERKKVCQCRLYGSQNSITKSYWHL